jgi:Glycosyl transferase family 2
VTRSVPLPPGARRLLRQALVRVGLWPARSGSRTTLARPATKRSHDGRSGSAPSLSAQVDAFQPPEPRPRRPEITAAVAVDDRLASGLAWEWTQRRVTSADWRDTLSGGTPPDLLVVQLVDGGIPGWGAVTGGLITELTTWCRQAGVRVVVWVTGADSPQSATDLVAAASLVCLHAEAAADAWRAAYPDTEIEVLPPAAQPRLHHPGRGGPGGRRVHSAAMVIDAGGPDATTKETLATLVAPAVASLRSREFEVWAIGDASVLPVQVAARRASTRPYLRVTPVIDTCRVLVDAGRSHPDGTWTVLEAGAAQSAVVTTSTQHASLPAEIAPFVVASDESAALRGEIVARLNQPELRDREALRLHRAVLAGHTYAHRVDQVLTSLGQPPAAGPRALTRSVSAVVPTNREHEIANILDNIARQSHDQTELVLVLHGLDLKHDEVTAQARAAGVEQLKVVGVDSSVAFGAAMNLGIDAADGAYIAKMDDDNFYGAHYLTDLVAAFDYTEAGVVGKWAHYVWLKASNAVVLRYIDAEHRYERRIQGGSMLLDGDLARTLRFGNLPRAIDSDFLDRAAADGVKIYSADRFNFVSVRGTDRQAHTWQVTDTTFMTASGRLEFYGDPRAHVDV